MAKTWAIAGVDLHLERTGTRVRAGLESALRQAIGSGRLTAGTKLPSSRVLAGDLGIARNTVAEVYGQLVAEGWLQARTGSGTTVATNPAAEAAPAVVERPRRARYDLRPGAPTLATFPRAAWLAATRRALNTAADDVFNYGDPAGQPQLRVTLAQYLARVRGVHAAPERIVVCTGFNQGLTLISRVLRERGVTTIGIEEYGHRLHREIIHNNSVRTRPLTVDQHGAQITDDVDALLLTPAHQFPIGVALAAPRRTAAIRSGIPVIEDDYDGEFRYDRQPVGALQALASDRVIYAGTVSKSLAPGLRLGWLVLPTHLRDDVVEAKRLTDGQTSVIEQLTLAEFIESGGYDRHIRRCRLVYRRRRDRLIAAMRRIDVRIQGVAAGLHALLDLPPGQSESDVIGKCADKGLAVDGLAEYHAHTPTRQALVVGYATPPEHSYTGALARLTAALKS